MYHLISCSICKTASPPPADVGWSMSDSRISAVGRRRLEYELQKILTVGWGINYISHHYPLCGLCAALYGCITCMPIFCHDSPYYTPLSLPTWHLVTGTLFFVYRFLRLFSDWIHGWYASNQRYVNLETRYRKSLAQGMQKTAEETALNSSSEIDTHTFMWTFDCLDEDHELESFFSGLPGFRSSKLVNDPVPNLTDEEMWRLYGALHGLLHRTFSSDLLPASVKDRRAMIGAKAIDRVHTPNASILYAILFKYQHSGPVVTKITNILKDRENNFDKRNASDAQVFISNIFANRESYDDSWYILASYELGFYEASLREYAAQGDNLSLVILIHLVRKQISHFRTKSHGQKSLFTSVLYNASKFKAKDTSLELQHEFCALWNQIVNETQGSNDRDMAKNSCARFATFSLLYTETPILPRLSSPRSSSITLPFWRSHPRIHCAKSQTTILTQHPTSTTTVSQRP